MRISRLYPLAAVAAAVVAFGSYGKLRTTEIIDPPPVSSPASGAVCEQTFDRMAAQRRLMADPALVSSRPDATDTRITPVEWMMLTDWQRAVVTAQNTNLPGNAAACATSPDPGTNVLRYTSP